MKALNRDAIQPAPAPVPSRGPAPPSPPSPPSAAYRPVPFWSWNERMTKGEVARQCGLFAGGGWGGAFVHSRVGLTTPYLGDEWFAACDATLRACEDLGLKVWLYDEDKWPSGYGGGNVPLTDEAFRMRVLIARRAGVDVPSHARPLGEARDGLQVYEWVASDGNPWFNGTCYADLMNPAAVRRFLDVAYEPYAARYGRHYGKLVTAQFTDEPASIFRIGLPRGAVPFSGVLVARYEELFRDDPTPRLHLLFADSPDAPAFRWRYFFAVNDLFENGFSRQIGSWCRDHGIALTGHFMAEQGLYDQQLWGVKVMANYRHQDIPGVDHLARQVNEVLTAKQCQSVVNQCGKRRMLSELYGVSGQNLSFEDRWWIASQQVALGVNLLNPHLSLYTMSGCRKRDYPPNLFYQQPWWPVNRVLDDRLSRLCEHTAQGRYVAEALVLHPQESVWLDWRTAADVSDPAAEAASDHEPTATGVRDALLRRDAGFKALLNGLLGGQIGFDLGDETILADDAAVDGITLRVGQMRYNVVVVPAMATIRGTTLDLLERFAANGGTLLRAGEVPGRVDGELSPKAAELLEEIPQTTVQQLADAVAETVGRAVLVEGLEPDVRANTFAHIRDLPGGDRLVMLTNLHRTRGGTARVSLADEWASVVRVDLDGGIEEQVPRERQGGASVVTLEMGPTRTHLLRLSKRDVTGPAAAAAASGLDEVVVDGWSVERLDDNALPLDYATWREGDGEWPPSAVPVLAIQNRLNAVSYDGPLTLRYAFRADTPGLAVRLVVEYPERYQIRVNGTEVRYAGLPHWRDIRWSPIDVAGLLRDGENVVELHCPDFRHGDLRSHDDPAARYGTEIEAVYLVGDFDVTADVERRSPDCPRWQEFGLPPVTQHYALPGTARLTPATAPGCGDVTAAGLPFYAGRLRYTAKLPKSDRPRRLRVGKLDAAVAEVAVDGEAVGHLVSHPYDVVLPPGGATLAITLYGTLRNLLGPHHHPEGELPVVSPPLFEPVYDGPVGDAVLAWARGEREPERWMHGHWLVGFGDLGRVTLEDLA